MVSSLNQRLPTSRRPPTHKSEIASNAHLRRLCQRKRVKLPLVRRRQHLLRALQQRRAGRAEGRHRGLVPGLRPAGLLRAARDRAAAGALEQQAVCVGAQVRGRAAARRRGAGGDAAGLAADGGAVEQRRGAGGGAWGLMGVGRREGALREMQPQVSPQHERANQTRKTQTRQPAHLPTPAPPRSSRCPAAAPPAASWAPR
jgi:hypothetical protein